MSDEWLKYLVVGLLIVFSFVPVTLQALRKRREAPPPMAKHDRKLYRLWRSDPDAYQRQYGDMDKQYQDALQRKKDAKDD